MPSTIFISKPISLFMNCSANQPAIPPMIMAAIQPISGSPMARLLTRGQPSTDLQILGRIRALDKRSAYVWSAYVVFRPTEPLPRSCRRFGLDTRRNHDASSRRRIRPRSFVIESSCWRVGLYLWGWLARTLSAILAANSAISTLSCPPKFREPGH